MSNSLAPGCTLGILLLIGSAGCSGPDGVVDRSNDMKGQPPGSHASSPAAGDGGAESKSPAGDGGDAPDGGPAPVADGGSPSPFHVSLAVGSLHSCVVTSTGSAKCWGDNTAGQLGTGNATSSNVPVAVVGISNVIALAAGGAHTCALTLAGGVKCWGDNSAGQLGIGTAGGSMKPPADVMGLTSGVTAIAAGGAYTCALTSAGGMKCWGANNLGQLGTGNTTNAAAPVDVTGLTTGVVAIAAGGSSARTSAAQIATPQGSSGQQASLGSFADFVVRNNVTCAVTTAGAARCWGGNGAAGGAGAAGSTPKEVATLASGALRIAVGSAHACALTTAGGAKCWGSDIPGQLGRGGTTNGSWSIFGGPVADVTGLKSDVRSIAAGAAHTCAVTTAGALECWGSNVRGQLGQGKLGAGPPVIGGDGIATRIEAGGIDSPKGVLGLAADVVAVEAGDLHTCALLSTGDVKCFGDNAHGQLGDGTNTTTGTPRQVGKF